MLIHFLLTCVCLYVSAYFLWANAVLGHPDTVTGITSPAQAVGTEHCLDFWFDLKVHI